MFLMFVQEVLIKNYTVVVTFGFGVKKERPPSKKGAT